MNGVKNVIKTVLLVSLLATVFSLGIWILPIQSVQAQSIDEVLLVLQNWGTNGPDGDFYQDGKVNEMDFGLVMIDWGMEPSPSPSPTTGPTVVIHAPHYDWFKNKLKAGDQVISGVNRQSEGSPPSSSLFNQRLDLLNAIDENEIGVIKSFMFSSYHDCETYIDQIPDDVTIISYNNEGSMTPSDERGAGVFNAVHQFANCVHGAGKMFTFIPVRSVWTSWSNDELNLILTDVDSIDYQGQNEISQGSQNFINIVTSVHDKLKAVNPNFEMYVQVWISRDDNHQEDIVAGFNAVQDLIDSAWIVGAQPMYDSPPTSSTISQTDYILDRLNWR
ncbi:hypothetical protein ACFL0Y_00020 [Patescibacteria group bacterium]